jgi:outer membrane receptor for ferrienterochelin and colicins
MFFQNQNAQYSVVGNGALQPETSTNLTAGAEWATDRLYFRGQVFWNEFRDFIETRTISAPDDPLVFRYENVDDGLTRGVDVEGGFATGPIRLDLSYSRLATEDRATGRPLLGRHDHSARVALSVDAPADLRLAATTVLTGRTAMSRDETSGAITGWRDAYVRTDLRAARRLPLDLELAVGADNVFDARPSTWAGFTGRRLYTSLSWSFTRAADPSTQ